MKTHALGRLFEGCGILVAVSAGKRKQRASPRCSHGIEPQRIPQGEGVVLVIADGLRCKFEAQIFAESSQQEERVLWLDTKLFNFDFIAGMDAMAQQ